MGNCRWWNGHDYRFKDFYIKEYDGERSYKSMHNSYILDVRVVKRCSKCGKTTTELFERYEFSRKQTRNEKRGELSKEGVLTRMEYVRKYE